MGFDSSQQQKQIEELKRRNEKLESELKELIKAEQRMLLANNRLDFQLRVFWKLYDAGKKFNSATSLIQIARTVTDFVVYALDFQFGFVVEMDRVRGKATLMGAEGPFEPTGRDRIAQALTEQTFPLRSDPRAEEPRIFPRIADPFSMSLASALRLAAFISITIPINERLELVVVGGNSCSESSVYSDPEQNEEGVLGLSNLAALASSSIRKMLFAQELVEERRLLKESKDRFHAIFESISDATVVHHAETGEILEVNNTMLEMFGYSRSEALKLKIQDLSLGESPYSQKERSDRSYFSVGIEAGPGRITPDFILKLELLAGYHLLPESNFTPAGAVELHHKLRRAPFKLLLELAAQSS